MTLDPLLLATAVEAVLDAGATQLAAFGTDFRVEKKGSIDLVTLADAVAGNTRQALLLLLAAAVLAALLIVVNVTNLFIARASARRSPPGRRTNTTVIPARRA